jgi:hypothetical protein
MVYALIVVTVTSYGAAHTQRVAQFNNFHDCAAFAVAWTDGQRSPESTVRWECQIEERP